MGFDGVDHHRRARHGGASPRDAAIDGVADAAVRALAGGRRLPVPRIELRRGDDRTPSSIASHRARRRSPATHSYRSQPAPHRHVAPACTDARGRLIDIRQWGRTKSSPSGRSPSTADLPGGPFAVVECRPPGTMACFNVSWGIAESLRERGWRATIDHRCGPGRTSVRDGRRRSRRHADPGGRSRRRRPPMAAVGRRHAASQLGPTRRGRRARLARAHARRASSPTSSPTAPRDRAHVQLIDHLVHSNLVREP